MKAQVMLRFLGILILTVLLLMAVFTFVNKLFRLTDEAKQSYTGFVQELKGAKTTVKSYSLRLNRETAVVFFNRDEEYSVMNSWNLKKPDKCQGTACVCLCRQITGTEPYFSCDASICDTSFDHHFTGTCTSRFDGDLPERKCTQGVIIGRDIFWYRANPQLQTVYFRLRDGSLEVTTQNPISDEFS